MNANECTYKGRPLTELSREELISALVQCYEIIERDRQYIPQLIAATDVKKYIARGGGRA